VVPLLLCAARAHGVAASGGTGRLLSGCGALVPTTVVSQGVVCCCQVAARCVTLTRVTLSCHRPRERRCKSCSGPMGGPQCPHAGLLHRQRCYGGAAGLPAAPPPVLRPGLERLVNMRSRSAQQSTQCLSGQVTARPACTLLLLLHPGTTHLLSRHCSCRVGSHTHRAHNADAGVSSGSGVHRMKAAVLHACWHCHGMHRCIQRWCFSQPRLTIQAGTPLPSTHTHAHTHTHTCRSAAAAAASCRRRCPSWPHRLAVLQHKACWPWQQRCCRQPRAGCGQARM
jgi:hypothetical protein